MTHPFPTRRSADLREGRFVLTVQDSHGHAAGVRTSLPTLAHSLPTLRRPSGAIDSMFLFRSNRAMSRVDDDTLALHLEVALSTAMPSLLDRLADPDRHRRNLAVGEIARQLVDRLRCFDIGGNEMGDRKSVE